MRDKILVSTRFLLLPVGDVSYAGCHGMIYIQGHILHSCRVQAAVVDRRNLVATSGPKVIARGQPWYHLLKLDGIIIENLPISLGR